MGESSFAGRNNSYNLSSGKASEIKNEMAEGLIINTMQIANRV